MSVSKCRSILIKISTKFSIKQVKFLPTGCTSLLLHSKSIQQNRLLFSRKFKKIRHTPRVNEIKVTLTNAFIGYICALENEKESKNDEKTLFGDYPRILEVAVNPYTTNAK